MYCIQFMHVTFDKIVAVHSQDSIRTGKPHACCTPQLRTIMYAAIQNHCMNTSYMSVA